MGYLDVLFYITLCLGVINAGLLTWMVFSLKRFSIRTLKNRHELLEADFGDLVQRFNRFQNRENLRKAREVKDDQRTLAEQAADVIAAQGAQNAPVHPGSRKAELRQRLRGKTQ